MRQKRKIPKKTVGLTYLEESITKDELSVLENNLKSCELVLLSREKRPQYIAGIEDFFPQIQVFLSPDVLQTICLGLATNAIYDGIKWFLLSLCRIVKEKPFVKISNGIIHKNEMPTIHFNLGQMHVVLPMDIDDEKFKYFVDKAFEAAKDQKKTSETFFVYSEESGEANQYTREEIAWQTYEDQSKE